MEVTDARYTLSGCMRPLNLDIMATDRKRSKSDPDCQALGVSLAVIGRSVILRRCFPPRLALADVHRSTFLFLWSNYTCAKQ